MLNGYQIKISLQIVPMPQDYTYGILSLQKLFLSLSIK